ncbi:hypothetical protein PM082_023842 [Marasmius tenuissimus]|nr:hypothetical protein PM082_023842 [Marasmius tenuissimus]
MSPDCSNQKVGEAIGFASINVEQLAKKDASHLKPTDAPASSEVTSQSDLLATVVTVHKPLEIIDQFKAKVKSIPQTIRNAKKGHAFSSYSSEPETYTTGIPREDLWPTFDGPFTTLVPTSDYKTRKHLILRGKHGLPAFVKLVKHLGYNCGMDITVLEPKLEWLMETINRARLLSFLCHSIH